MINYLKSLTVFCAIWLFTGCTSNAKRHPDENSSAITLGSIKLTSLSGAEIDMEEFKGKAIFINFWATWCKPCIQEMPTIEKAQEQLENKDVVFLLASNETAEQIENFKNKKKFKFHYVRVENLEALNIQALPATYIFNPQGELVFSEAGYRMWDAPENIDLITKHSSL